MPTRSTKFWLALKSRIDTIVTDPVLPRAEPGQTYTPPNNQPFLLIQDARNDPERIGVGPDMHIYSGTLMLAVRWPMSLPVTHAQLSEVAGTIAEHFPADLSMQFGGECIRVQVTPEPQFYTEGVYRVALVRVFWGSN